MTEGQEGVTSTAQQLTKATVLGKKESHVHALPRGIRTHTHTHTHTHRSKKQSHLHASMYPAPHMTHVSSSSYTQEGKKESHLHAMARGISSAAAVVICLSGIEEEDTCVI